MRRPIRAQAGLDEAFDLAVGARRLGSGALVLNAVPDQQVAEGVAPVGRAVVGRDTLDRRTAPGEPIDRAAGEGDRAFLALIGQQPGVGEPRGVIDRR